MKKVLHPFLSLLVRYTLLSLSLYVEHISANEFVS